ncbi:MAG: hypothetical protein LH629_14365 [Ignavibacteria bacterium]|nr:hypothetical protein [Ignavibacteria bacterium]
MTVEDYKVILASIPDAPGVDRFIDKYDIAIYVGKAKNIKKRITSYFNKSQQYR